MHAAGLFHFVMLDKVYKKWYLIILSDCPDFLGQITEVPVVTNQRLSKGVRQFAREYMRTGWGDAPFIELPDAEVLAELELRVQAELALLLALVNPAGLLEVDGSDHKKLVGGLRDVLAALLGDKLGKGDLKKISAFLIAEEYVASRRGTSGTTIYPEWVKKFEALIATVLKEVVAVEEAQPAPQPVKFDEDLDPGSTIAVTATSLEVIHARRRSIEGMADERVTAILRRLEAGGQVPAHVMPYMAQLLGILAPAFADSERDVVLAALRKLETVFADGATTIELPN